MSKMLGCGLAIIIPAAVDTEAGEVSALPEQLQTVSLIGERRLRLDPSRPISPSSI
jgi:hypothetical protein